MSFHLPRIGPDLNAPVDRHNFWLGVVNGVIASGAEAFTEPYVVLTYFASLLTDLKFLIGLVAPIQIGGWFLPQLLASGFIERRQRKLPMYTVVGWLRVAAALGMVAVLWFVREPGLLLWLFLVALIVNRLTEGTVGPCFLDVIGKIVAPNQRGVFFGARRLFGGVLALAVSGVVGWVLTAGTNWVFPHQFALLYGLYAVFYAVTITLFTRVKEPTEPVSPRRTDLSTQMRRGLQLTVRNRAYGRFLLARTLMVIADMALPFYVVYARQELGASAGMVGIYLSTSTLTALLINLWAARVSDRSGNRRLLLAAGWVGLASPALTLLLGWWGASPLTFTLVFALNGVYNSSVWLAHFNFLLDVAPPGDRPLYLSTANTLIGVAILASSAGGALIDWLGYGPLFGLALGAMLAGTGVLLTMPEPRAQVAMVTSSAKGEA